jgi:flagellar hook assembly protein FlgD
MFPNPFKLTTSLHYFLSQASRVKIYICDIQGRTIRVLFNGLQTKGHHDIGWDGKQQSGQLVNNGVYLIKLESDSKTLSRNVIHAK